MEQNILDKKKNIRMQYTDYPKGLEIYIVRTSTHDTYGYLLCSLEANSLWYCLSNNLWPPQHKYWESRQAIWNALLRSHEEKTNTKNSVMDMH